MATGSPAVVGITYLSLDSSLGVVFRVNQHIVSPPDCSKDVSERSLLSKGTMFVSDWGETQRERGKRRGEGLFRL